MISNFLFHRVGPEKDSLWQPMHPDLFRKCLKYISANFDLVQAEDLPEIIQHHEKERYASISFDDGYLDNYTQALPILEELSVKASFYVVTDCISRNIPTWTYIFDHIFQHSDKAFQVPGLSFIPAEFKNKTLSNRSEKLEFARKLKPILKNITQEEFEGIYNICINQLSEGDLPRVMMNWDQVKRLTELGHQVGSHTCTHPMLARMKNDSIQKELSGSREAIKQMTGRYPLTISYPIGSYNKEVKRISAECGYKIGLAVKQDVYVPERDDIFSMPRIELYNESWLKTKWRINNRIRLIKKLVGKA